MSFDNDLGSENKKQKRFKSKKESRGNEERFKSKLWVCEWVCVSGCVYVCECLCVCVCVFVYVCLCM